MRTALAFYDDDDEPNQVAGALRAVTAGFARSVRATRPAPGTEPGECSRCGHRLQQLRRCAGCGKPREN